MSKVHVYKRKIAGLTNYKRRLTLLKSGKTRLVVRSSNKYLILQLVDYKVDGDKVLCSINSNELKKYGWKQSCNNLPSAYLAGLLLAKKSSKIKEAILDIGRNISQVGGKIYAAMKGVNDGGVSINHDESVLPSEDRISGKHMGDKVVKNFEEVKKKINS